jgi:hypothetical protein
MSCAPDVNENTLKKQTLVHGGPGPKCLASSCYEAIVKDFGSPQIHADLNDVPDVDLRASLNLLSKASDADEAIAIIDSEKLDVLFDMDGTLRVVKSTSDIQHMVQKTVDWYVLGRVLPAYHSFREGLKVSRRRTFEVS